MRHDQIDPQGPQKWATLIMPWAMMVCSIVGIPWSIWVTRSIMVLEPDLPRIKPADTQLARVLVIAEINATTQSRFSAVDGKLDILASKLDTKFESMRTQFDKVNIALAKKGITEIP